MKDPIRLAAFLLLGFGALSLSGCIMPVQHRRGHPRGHAWVHHRHEDVYFCTPHGEYWIYPPAPPEHQPPGEEMNS